MFSFFRYALIPVVLFCGVIITASVDSYATNASHAANWRPITVTVVESADFGAVGAKLRGEPNSFPDPYGTVTYVVDGKSYSWHGRGRDIELTVMTPGTAVAMYYDPADPKNISTLVMLGAFTGNIIAGTAVAFVTFYAWFFWLRRFTGRSGPRDSGGAGGDPLLEPLQEMIDLPAPSQQLRPMKAPARPHGRGRPAFGRR